MQIESIQFDAKLSWKRFEFENATNSNKENDLK